MLKMDNNDDFTCPVCARKLCRKQRLQSHMEIMHGDHYDLTKYKKYLTDEKVSVPRSTLHNRRQRQEENVSFPSPDARDNGTVATTSDYNHDDSQVTDHHSEVSVIVTETIPNERTDICQEQPRDHCLMQMTINEHDETQLSGSDISSDDNISVDNLDLSLSSETDDISDSATGDVGQEYLEETVPCKKQKTFTNEEEKKMSILSYVMKHHLSGQATQDLLDLSNLMHRSTSSEVYSVSSLKEVIRTCNAQIIDYCSVCFTLFPDDNDIIHCVQDSCPGLRFKGPLNKQQEKKRSCYFACLSVQNQIKCILEREGVWKAMLKFRKKSEECTSLSHVSDITSAEIVKELRKQGNFLHEENNFSLLFNTDGVPLYQSSGVSIWPVYLIVNELPQVMRFARKNMILWGMWQGHGKPMFRTFLQPFIKEMKSLKNVGITLTLDGVSRCCKGILLAGTLDLQAKAIVAEMTHHNGAHPCITCNERGIVVQQGRGHTRVFPYTEEETVKRTTTEILQSGLEASQSQKTVNGIKSVSCLLGMEWFDIVYGLVPDYMHGVLLGVTKKMLQLLFSTTNSRKPFFIGHALKEIDKRLVNMQPTDQIERLPRKLEKHMHQFKASELQMWLLYYCIPCLTGLMEGSYLDHLALMVEGVYILLGDNISARSLNRAEDVLRAFHAEFAQLY